jgi:hypothetical protein
MPELILFIAALIAGTACSLTSKVMLDMKAIGLSGKVENFTFPLFQTFGMFFGMTFALIMHYAVVAFKIPMPGYVHQATNGKYMAITGEVTEPNPPIPRYMYWLLAIPSIFDLVATQLCMYGLLYVDVSIYQMLRGGAIVFVALLKQFVLGDKLYNFQWVGVLWNVVSIVLVGATAALSPPDDSTEDGVDTNSNAGLAILGVVLILLGALVQSMQYAFEERVMTMDASAPPLFLIGMEGLWGSIICLFILYPASYAIPGTDHGSLENPFNTYTMMSNSSAICGIFVLYFLSIFVYNMLAILITYMLNSVWHAILDNFRPVTVWSTDLVLFYCITAGAFGETWSKFSWLQVLGMFVLLYGTAIYNAPNPGSLLLKGEWFNFGLDFTKEYAEAEDEAFDADDRSKASSNAGSYLHTMSPFMSPSVQYRSRETSRDGPNRSKGYGSIEMGGSGGQKTRTGSY